MRLPYSSCLLCADGDNIAGKEGRGGELASFPIKPRLICD